MLWDVGQLPDRCARESSRILQRAVPIKPQAPAADDEVTNSPRQQHQQQPAYKQGQHCGPACLGEK